MIFFNPFSEDIDDFIRRVFGAASRDTSIYKSEDGKYLYITVNIPDIKDVANINYFNGVIHIDYTTIWGDERYRAISIDLPVKEIKEYTVRNGVLDIEVELHEYI